MTPYVTLRGLPEGIQTATTALVVAICYCFSARFGLILSLKPDNIAALWPPNAVAFIQIKNAQPKMKIIVCSGYALKGPTKEILDLGADGFLQKPFSLQNSSLKIKEILEAKSYFFTSIYGRISIL